MLATLGSTASGQRASCLEFPVVTDLLWDTIIYCEMICLDPKSYILRNCDLDGFTLLLILLFHCVSLSGA